MRKNVFKIYWIILLLYFTFCSFQSYGAVIYTDGMETTANGWNERSNAINEAGDSSGGIQVVSGNKFQMNSWWDGAGWTSIWRGVGHTIQANTVYLFTASLQSYASGKSVMLKFKDADDNWSDIKTEPVDPDTGSFGEFFISFDSSNYPQFVGHSLAIAVEGGWWNNFAVTEVVVETSPSTANVITFDTTEPGVTKTLDFWGVDQTWVSSNNMTTTINNIGYADTDAVRIGFPKDYSLEYSGGVPTLSTGAKSQVDSAMNQVTRVPDADLTIQGHPKGGMSSWYVDTDNEINPVRWVDGFVATINYVNSTYGYTINDWAFLEVYNEPDWDSPNVSRSNMAEVMAEVRTRSQLDAIPILGPSTLSCDWAQSWYDSTDTDTDIGGCHVINGSMTNLISFINNIHADGKAFINPEIHNYIEVMIAADLSDRPGEGGLFWGDVTEAEGRFIQACKGKRIAYEMHEPTWSGTCVYRDNEGRIWAFAGSSERHAESSKWEFVCSDREVFFDGAGPTYSTSITMGGHEFQHMEVTWGDRNPLYVSQYLDNISENLRLAVSGTIVYTTTTSQINDHARWEFRPVGAFYHIDNVGKKNASQNSRLIATETSSPLQLASSSDTSDFVKWQLMSNGDDFHLENVGMQRLGVASRLKVASDGSLLFIDSSDSTDSVLWAFTDTGVTDSMSPAVVQGLTVTTGDSAIWLDWSNSTDWDFSSYTVRRSTISGSGYSEIASGLNTSNYKDDTVINNTTYFYVLTAVDSFGNESASSSEVKVRPQAPIAYDGFESDDFTGGVGWDSAWQLLGSTTPTIVTFNDNESAKISNDGIIVRTIDVPVYESILYFKYDVDGLEAGDSVAAEVYDVVEGQWTNVWTGYYYDNNFDVAGEPDSLQQTIIDLSSYGPYISQIRFTASANSSNDIVYIDDIAVFPKTYITLAPQAVFHDSMESVSAWNEDSNASNETGDTTGGIRATGDSIYIQMNSWWDGAGWTRLWKDTGHVILPYTRYTFTVRIKSFSSGKSVNLRFQDVDNGWANIYTEAINPLTTSYTDRSISFNTEDYPASVGHNLGIAIEPGWWNNLGITQVMVEATPLYHEGDFNRSGDVDFVDFSALAQQWQTGYSFTNLIELAEDWLIIDE